MQGIIGEKLIERAKSLLSDGRVTRVLGWKAGEFCYDVTPALFPDEKSLSDFVWGDFCGANLSKYLISETKKGDGKVLVFLKPCDSYSFNQLLTEHRFDREKVYIIGVPCEGMLDVGRIRAHTDGISAIRSTGERVVVSTLYDGDYTLDRRDCLPDRCLNCKSKKHVIYDERLGQEGEILDSRRFEEVEALEKLSAKERYAFWQGELSRCIRCNACRDVCPACSCEKCVFDNPHSGLENKAAANSFEEKLFHIIRAFHVAGRCTDCGECSRVCPQHIPLHLLNRKFIKDINQFYGEYQAGAEIGSRSPLTDFTPGDPEPSEVLKGGTDHA